MKCSTKTFSSKCDQIRSFDWIWSYLLKKVLMKNFISGVMKVICFSYIKQIFCMSLKDKRLEKNHKPKIEFH